MWWSRCDLDLRIFWPLSNRGVVYSTRYQPPFVSKEMFSGERGEALYVGGTLIRRFDGFRRLCRHAAYEFQHKLSMPDEDLLLANRVLAALGGPPAASQVRGSFVGDGLGLLNLFLLTQEIPCRIGLVGDTEPAIARIKSLVHLFGHAVYPTVTGLGPMEFKQVVRELGPTSVLLRPLITYDSDGEPLEILETGAAGQLLTGHDGGPYILAVLLNHQAGIAPLASAGGPLHPTVLIYE